MTTIFVVALLVGGIWFLMQRSDARDTEGDPCRYCPDNRVHEQAPARSAEKPAADTVTSPQEQDMPEAAEGPGASTPTGRIDERLLDKLALSLVTMTVAAVVMLLQIDRDISLIAEQQGKETTIWSHVQTKNMKEHASLAARNNLELQQASLPGMSPELSEKYGTAFRAYDAELKRYKDEKDDLLEQAATVGKKKERYQRRVTGFSNALEFLLASIVLSSVSVLLRRVHLWYAALLLLAGWFYFLVTAF